MLTIDINQLKALTFAATTEETRYYLKGVFIEAQTDKVLGVATDGHRLLAMKLDATWDETPTPFSIIIPLSTITSIKIDRRISVATLSKINDKWTLTHVDQTILFEPVDGTYPDWRRIVPDTVSGEAAQYNPALLADFLKINKQLGVKGGGLPQIYHNGDSAAVVKLPVEIEHVGLLMPVRAKVSNGDYSKPAWASHTTAAA
jgi:DNA polymerase-3 subunit beta